MYITSQPQIYTPLKHEIMINKETALSPGQTLRYVGKSFPGFVKELPYMTFISHHNSYQYLARYNDIQVVVNKRYAIPV